jgi:hypothetical protein
MAASMMAESNEVYHLDGISTTEGTLRLDWRLLWDISRVPGLRLAVHIE